MSDATEQTRAQAESLRGRYISRVADLERGIDANLYLFLGVEPEREAMFRSAILAHVGLAAKIGAIGQIVALYDLRKDERFSQLLKLLERCNHVRNVLAHGRDVIPPLRRRSDGRVIFNVSWARRGKETFERFDVEAIFEDAAKCNRSLLELLGETLRRFPERRSSL